MKTQEPSADAVYIGDQIRHGLSSIADSIAGGRSPENVAMSTRDVANAIEELSGALQNAFQELSLSIDAASTDEDEGAD